MKLAILASLSISAAAFAPAPAGRASTAIKDLNGWVPDESKFAWGLPGSLDPAPEFDPFNFAEGTPLNNMKQWREAETQHARVAMLAAVGLLVTEEPIEYHPLFEAYNKDIGPAIRHLDEVDAQSPFFLLGLTLLIGSLEWNRALKGFSKPEGEFSFQQLQDDYYPGDIGFDPLGLKPEDPEEFAIMQTKELQNGRLAMLGAAGMIAQELVNGEEIFVNLGLAQDRFDPSSVPIQF
jgi:light-harvesting complex I chlorophyll a/b binding protein 1